MMVPRPAFSAGSMVNSPLPSEVQRQRLALARLARDDLDPLGHHEGGIEADAELADQGHVLLRVARQRADEGRGARARDGAEIVDQLVVAHADAVIGNGEACGLASSGVSDDAEFGVAGDELGLGQRQIAQPVAGIRRVGDQLAQEDLLLAVERMGDDIQAGG